MEDIEAQRIDCVLVYKVDRLSRSLLDFARLIDRFDQHSVSFVSVTQQFNTTTSIGRLTLNILLSFAQFEREVIGERTRDKMSAARRKGKWTGGMPVLGYDVDPNGGRLVNEQEAARVREIFRLYETHYSVAAVQAELERREWTTKSWISKHGSRRGGHPFSKATLLRLLTNAIYAGQVEHKGMMYAGQHAAIVEPALWHSVNGELRARRAKNGVSRTAQNSLLKELLFCRHCDQPMAPSYTSKGDRRYRYYVCRACSKQSIAAGVIEESVLAQVRLALTAEEARAQLEVSDTEWRALSENDSTEFVRAIVQRVVYDGATGSVSLELGRR